MTTMTGSDIRAAKMTIGSLLKTPAFRDAVRLLEGTHEDDMENISDERLLEITRTLAAVFERLTGVMPDAKRLTAHLELHCKPRITRAILKQDGPPPVRVLFHLLEGDEDTD